MFYGQFEIVRFEEIHFFSLGDMFQKDFVKVRSTSDLVKPVHATKHAG